SSKPSRRRVIVNKAGLALTGRAPASAVGPPATTPGSTVVGRWHHGSDANDGRLSWVCRALAPQARPRASVKETKRFGPPGELLVHSCDCHRTTAGALCPCGDHRTAWVLAQSRA